MAAAAPPALRPAAQGTERRATFAEELKQLPAWFERTRGTWRGRLAVVGVSAFLGLLVWLVLTRMIPGSLSPAELAGRVLALEAPWSPVPSLDDPRVQRDTGLGTAARIGAPFIIATFWFVAAYHLDRSARRTFRTSLVPGEGHSLAYGITAIGCVFPLIILGLVAGTWGLFALLTWAATQQAWPATIAVLALMLGFAGAVRLANGLLDRRDTLRAPRPR
ncbi:MAG: hypothetical protein FJ029_06995 [Actinobacteria bacterium]|nr:hypothetical protein [Actinomycetota bacterium]